MNNRGRNWYRNKGKRKRNSDVQTGGSGGTSRPHKKSSSNAMETSKHGTPIRQSENHSVYHNWKFYFHDEDYKTGSSTDRKIQVMQEFVIRHPDLFPVSNLENNKAYNVDLLILYKDDIFMNEWKTFKEDLVDNPRHTLNCLGVAIDQMMINIINDPNISSNLPRAIARVSNYRPVKPLRDLKVYSYGKLISVRGCIMRVGGIKHFAQWIEFSCMSCTTHKVVRQVDGIYTLPTKCIACNGKKFRPVLSSLNTKTVTFQVIRLQEHFGDEQDDKGRRPRTIDVDLIEDLVCTCIPGNDVTVTGIIKIRGSETHSSKGNINSNLRSLYMEAVYIHNNKFQSQNKSGMGHDLTAVDHNAIREIYHDPNVFKLLVHSLCPSIYGHEFIKAGLLLSLFGGSAKTHDVRDDIHILVFGDPGLGKSQLLQACSRVASKGVYVCGSSSTSTGLTVTLAKDSGSSGELVLEPGALVMADKGCCCIDEFDKMSTQYQALLEAMEQQSVSLAKSGMVCCLPARTSILAAANPAGGRYRRAKTLVENLNMSLPLLSRFDLIFILLDQPNEHLDNLLSDHVMALHAGKNDEIGDLRRRGANSPSQLRTQSSLGQKLCTLPTDTIDPIPQRILRNYISYAKQYVKPSITPAAAEVLQNFYLECRARHDREKITPMTPRQLGALIRLTEARAKLELREQATHNDALEIVEIIAYSMADVSIEPIDLDHSILTGSGKMTANKVKAFVKLLMQQATATGNKVFTTMEMKDIAKRENLVIDNFNALITKLNENGIILKKGAHLYALTSNDE